MTEIDKLLKNNIHNIKNPLKRTLSKEPVKKIAILTCMDARINVYKIFGLCEGDAHIIRNAGGILSEDVIRSLLISQISLGTREIIIMQHTDCGMLSFTDNKFNEILDENIGIKATFPLCFFSNIEESIGKSVRQLLNSPYILYKESIRGFIYDVKSKRLIEVKV